VRSTSERPPTDDPGQRPSTEQAVDQAEQAQSCHTGHGSTGVTTQDPRRQKSLVDTDKARRVYNFHDMTLHALKEMVQPAGLGHPSAITAHHIVRRSTDGKVRSLAQSVLTQMHDGALLQSDLTGLPLIYRQSWPQGGHVPRAPPALASPGPPRGCEETWERPGVSS